MAKMEKGRRWEKEWRGGIEGGEEDGYCNEGKKGMKMEHGVRRKAIKDMKKRRMGVERKG